MKNRPTRSAIRPLGFVAVLFAGVATAAGAASCDLNWTDMQATPMAPSYIPQGLAHDEKGLILTAYSKSEQPAVRFFRKAGKTWTALSGDSGPLLHTSGLVPYKGSFFLIDYDSGLVGKVRISEDSFLLEGLWKTGNPKISSGFIAKFQGKDYLVVSEFGLIGRHHWYRAADLAPGRADITPEFSTPASSFIQGNTALGDQIVLEAVNKIGKDQIRFLRMPPRKGGLEIVGKARFSGPMIEDVALFSGRVYTTDEKTFRLYGADIDEACMQ